MDLRDMNVRRIALIKPSAMGDIVHSLPVLHALRCRFPAASISWVVNRSYAGLLEGHSDLDEIIAYDRAAGRAGWQCGLAEFARLLRAIRRRRFDLVVDLQGLLRTGLMAWASQATVRMGLSSARERAEWFYTHTLAVPDPNMHAVDRYWLVAEALRVGGLPKRFDLPMPESARRWADGRLRGWPRPWIMVNAGTRWETKRWPAGHFATLCRWALGRFGGSVVVVGGREEKPLARAIGCSLQPCLELTGRTTLPQLTAVLARADLVVSNDSGPLHLAAALGRPVVAPFTCTSPARTGPYGQPNGVVLTQVDCAASYLKRCGRMVCMAELTPERLWPLVERALASWQRASA